MTWQQGAAADAVSIASMPWPLRFGFHRPVGSQISSRGMPDGKRGFAGPLHCVSSRMMRPQRTN